MGMRDAINATRLDRARKADDLRKQAAVAYHDGDTSTFEELNRQAAEIRQELEDGQ